MKKIYKYRLEVKDEIQELRIPDGYRVVHVAGGENGDPDLYFWVEFDVDYVVNTIERFRIFGTGHEIPNEFSYVGTVRPANGYFVWHIYKKDF